MERPARSCPAVSAPLGACPEARPPGDTAAAMPREGALRAVMLALRFVAAAAETGDAACWDAAFDRAEAEFGPRDGALLVARAGAMVRALDREGAGVRFLPPPCRRLSPGEADLLAGLRARLGGRSGPALASGGSRAAFSDLVAPLLSPRCPLALPAPMERRRPSEA